MGNRGNKEPSSMRNANIRIMSVNETVENGRVEYVKDDIYNIIKEWSESCSFIYWMIEHSADDEVSCTHWHIVLKFKSPMPWDNVKKKFPYGYIETCKTGIKNCVQYLIHLNDKSKVQYSWDDVITNCDDMTPFKVRTASQSDCEIEYYIDLIEKGLIREYNQFDKIPISIWSRNKSVIGNALTYYREKIYMDKNRQIRVVFMSGNTGTGKTTFAKKYCETMNKSYSVSSSSNDPFQDYKGEDVLILDDLRQETFAFADLLKILDNHTKSTMTSRFHNKAFIGDTIIITSHRPLSDWYMNIESEDKHQLYRRIQEQFKFYSDDVIKAYIYDEEKHKYEHVKTFKNTFKVKDKCRSSVLNEMLEMMGDEANIVTENYVQISLDDSMKNPFDKKIS